MTRTVYLTASSLDGFIAGSDNSLEWLTALPKTEAKKARFDSFFETVGAIAMGSTTFEWVVAAGNLLEPQRWREEWCGRPSWVFSTRRLSMPDDPDVRLVSGDVRRYHAEMVTAAQGRDVRVVGGGDLAAQFAAAGLLDVFRIGVAPVTLGAGAPLFPRGSPANSN